MINLFLRCKPEAQKRVKVFNRIAVDPSKEYKNFLKLQILEQYQEKPIEGPISLQLYFAMPIPSSTSKKRKQAMLDGLIPHTKKPDLDNLCKGIFDAMNKTIIKDDSQIFSLYTYKFYSENPGIEIQINTEGKKREKEVKISKEN